MTTPSQIAVEAAGDWLGIEPQHNSRLVTSIQSAIDKATSELSAEIERLKEQRNRAAMEERQKYLPILAKMVPIEDVKPLLEAIRFNMAEMTTSHRLALALDQFLTTHNDKLK